MIMSTLVHASLGEAALLGVIQGLTEFLPVSSSGHLVLLQQFMSLEHDQILFDLILHVGTLIPILWFYRADIQNILKDLTTGVQPLLQRPGVKLLALLATATVPTGIIGLLFEDLFEEMFANPTFLPVSFMITGTLLYSIRRLNEGDTDGLSMTFKHALILGLAQGFAITPGISRSGTTIVVALMLGLNRTFAAKFSFLMSVPAILGAVLLKTLKAEPGALDMLDVAMGGSTALIAGYLALVLLVSMVKKGSFTHFCWYCWGIACVSGLIAYMG
jgi:undecaprenyl-diphosphatase